MPGGHGQIQQLSEDVIRKIAAGEVIERPASVVKELVENSLDAGADRVEIEVRAGGREFIRVTDNGVGIDPEDLPLVLTRHATSKLTTAEDLFRVYTLGFRGEALASIAAVSRFTLRSRRHSLPQGYAIHAEDPSTHQPVGMAPGTVVEVRELFYNTPARYKFLRSPAAEQRHVTQAVTSIALAAPERSVTLVADGKTVLHTPGTGKHRDAIASLWGVRLAQQLVAVEYESKAASVKGFVGPPETAKGTRAGQTCIVNERVIRNATIAKAVERAYQDLLPSRRFPLFVLTLTLDPAMIDVNAHPTKLEIRFADESTIFQTVMTAVRQALHSVDFSPRIALGKERAKVTAPSQETADEHHQLSLPGQRSKGPQAAGLFPQDPETWDQVDALVAENSSASVPKEKADVVRETTAGPLSASETAASSDSTRQAAGSAPKPTEESGKAVSSAAEEVKEQLMQARFIGQLHQSYLLLETTTGLALLDQHAAHERVLFEQYRQQKAPPIQRIFPLTLDLPLSIAKLAACYKQELRRYGIELGIDEDGTVSLQGTSAVLSARGPWEEPLTDIVEALENGDAEDLNRKAASIMACRAAAKFGEHVDATGVRWLLRELLQTGAPLRCPHGRPVMVLLEDRQLRQWFDR